MNKKILLIGPRPDPVTGVSLANAVIYENIGKYGKYSIDGINMSYSKLEGLGSFSFEKAFFYAKLYKNIFKICKADIVYITPGQTFFGVVKYAPFIFFARILKKQMLAHIHGNYLHLEYKTVSGWKQRVMYFILSKVDKGIVLSGLLRDNMTPFIDTKHIYELKNFAGDELFTRNSGEDDLHTDHLRVLYLSNLIPEKGIFDLLDALLILQNKGISFTAQIAGSIDPQNADKIHAKLHALSKNVEYLGIVGGQNKKNALLQSNVFVFPTYYPMEGQPISILEAMATGNIILTTNHAGIADIFTDVINGYYVEKHSPENVAQKLINISGDLKAQKHIMENNKQIAAEQYRVESFINNFIKILES